MDKLSEWIESQLDDRNIFPVAPTDPFPPNFNEVVRNIFKRLFRVYGHIYHHHFKHVCNLGAEVGGQRGAGGSKHVRFQRAARLT